jgi:uncharacterized protein
VPASARRVALAYIEDSVWRNRDQFVTGRECWRGHGNELWEFTDDGLMRRREASVNDVAIAASDRAAGLPLEPAARPVSLHSPPAESTRSAHSRLTWRCPAQ